MLRALAETRIEGIQTSVPFFVSLLNDPRVVANDISTQFLDTFRYEPPAPEDGLRDLALSAAVLEALEETKSVRPRAMGAAPAPWRTARPTHGRALMQYHARFAGAGPTGVALSVDGPASLLCDRDARAASSPATRARLGEGVWSLVTSEGRQAEVRIERAPDGAVRARIGAVTFEFDLLDELTARALLATGGRAVRRAGHVAAAMPGRVLRVLVAAGRRRRGRAAPRRPRGDEDGERGEVPAGRGHLRSRRRAGTGRQRGRGPRALRGRPRVRPDFRPWRGIA